MGVEKIGCGAFSGCKSLMRIGKLLSTVKVIEKEAFQNCENLTGVELEECLQTIGDKAFQGCYSLQHKIILPSSIKSFGNQVFNNCTMLQSIDMREDNNIALALTLAGQYHYKTPKISMKRFIKMYSREKLSSQQVDKLRDVSTDFVETTSPIKKLEEVKNAYFEHIESIRRLVLWRVCCGPSLALGKSRGLDAGKGSNDTEADTNKDKVADAVKDSEDVDANDQDARKMRKKVYNEELCKRAPTYSESTRKARVEKETDDYLVTLIKVIKEKADEAGKGHLITLNPGASAEALKNLAERVPLRCPAGLEKLLKYTNGAYVHNLRIPSVDEIIEHWHFHASLKLYKEQECYPFGMDDTDGECWYVIDPNGNCWEVDGESEEIRFWGALPLNMEMEGRKLWLAAEELAKDVEYRAWWAEAKPQDLDYAPDWGLTVYQTFVRLWG